MARARRAIRATEHLEPGYALTGHGAQGATIEWAGVIGRPSKFSRERAYTALSRARGRTRVYLISEATAKQRDREEFSPPELAPTLEEALLNNTRLAMTRHEALAIENAEPAELPAIQALGRCDCR